MVRLLSESLTSMERRGKRLVSSQFDSRKEERQRTQMMKSTFTPRW